MGFQGNALDSQDSCLALSAPLGLVSRSGSANRSEGAKASSVRDARSRVMGQCASGSVSGLAQLLWGAHVSGQASMPSKGKEQTFRSLLAGLEATGGRDEKPRTSDLTHL